MTENSPSLTTDPDDEHPRPAPRRALRLALTLARDSLTSPHPEFRMAVQKAILRFLDCLSPYNRAISGAPANAILASVSRPVSIFTVAHEAHELAIAAQGPVAFLFIGKLVVVRPDDVPVTIGRSWWMDVHGWIPEQFQ